MPGFTFVFDRSNELPAEHVLSTISFDHDTVIKRLFGRYKALVIALNKEIPQLAIVESRERFLLVDGFPDRLPRDGESVFEWLASTSGSFRGIAIEHDSSNAIAFVDNQASRELFVGEHNGRVYISDKLWSHAVNCNDAEPDVGNLLFAVAFGSLPTRATTIHGVRSLRPGEMFEIDANRLSFNGPDPAKEERQFSSQEEAVAALASAMSQSLAEVDATPCSLFFSGGSDSELLLARLSHLDSAITFDLRRSETEQAESLATAAGVAWTKVTFPEKHWSNVAEYACFLTGGLLDSQFATHFQILGGVFNPKCKFVVNGYLFDTLLKGYFLKRSDAIPPARRRLRALVGEKADIFDLCIGRKNSGGFDFLWTLLKPNGRDLLENATKAVFDSIQTTVSGTLETTLDSIVLGQISRQIHFATLLAWMEQAPSSTPVLHPSIWKWVARCPPQFRCGRHTFGEAARRLQDPDHDHGGKAYSEPRVEESSQLIALSKAFLKPKLYRAGLRRYPKLRRSVCASNLVREGYIATLRRNLESGDSSRYVDMSATLQAIDVLENNGAVNDEVLLGLNSLSRLLQHPQLTLGISPFLASR
ncbi:hypothetical protein K227x_46990 [Rubripirellula lacrimiformis]|uniref:Asparagine synthetase domain-containing protein n=1 Tax=Rubripirellula lacrimiformis TaxID=1930273 RepID=A0A517NGN4_9BACT|nr:hypothetical protein [Rubripirellula lacrimiformis]QDT06290.1 hypothetical protein K227x_46990 [Rubripirellula lacrimiformis]